MTEKLIYLQLGLTEFPLRQGVGWPLKRPFPVWALKAWSTPASWIENFWRFLSKMAKVFSLFNWEHFCFRRRFPQNFEFQLIHDYSWISQQAQHGVSWRDGAASNQLRTRMCEGRDWELALIKLKSGKFKSSKQHYDWKHAIFVTDIGYFQVVF